MNSYLQKADIPMPHMLSNDSPSTSSSSSSTSSFDSTFTSDSRSSYSSDGFSSRNGENKSTPSMGVNLRVTGQCSQGGRKYMEDYFSVAYQQSDATKDLDYAFIGIYDGHGGAEAATFAKEHLMMEIINQKLFWSDSDNDVKQAIREGFISTHYAMWRDQANWPKTNNGLPSTAGTTATIAFIRREKIFIGHVGDSGIVLGYQNENENFWRAKQLTTDHKPESNDERTRIIRSGGKVIVKSGVPRVVWNRPRNSSHVGPILQSTPVDEIPFLAVARSLGDLWSYNAAFNEFVVSPDPDVRVVKINPKTFKCLIFGTDGLWNVVSAQEAVNSVFEKESINVRLQMQRGECAAEGTQWTNPSKGLVDQALNAWSSKKMRADNTSVVTVILYPPGHNINATSSKQNNDSLKETNTLSSKYEIELISPSSESINYENEISYQEIVKKFMPPKEFSDFNFYDEISEESEFIQNAEKNDDDEYSLKYGRETEGILWNVLYDKPAESSSGTEYDNTNQSSWTWEKYNDKAKIVLNCDKDENDHELDDFEDENTETDCSMIEYDHFMTPPSSVLPSEDRCVDHQTNFISSFAESYNSLLTEQMSQESSTSNSNASFKSISGSDLREILQEQQMYQQQCMSEEEGYSLTKLETRGSQQRNSGVQTFKIVHHPSKSSSNNNIYNISTPVESTCREYPNESWESRTASLTGTINKFLAQHQQQSKPLELNSLLQQEREEEQQVALERLQMQNKISNDSSKGIWAYNLNPMSWHSINGHDSNSNSALSDEATYVEYLEEEMFPDSSLDESVQINEISSSSAAFDRTINYRHNKIINKMNETALDMEMGHSISERDRVRPSFIEKIEKIEILMDKPELVIEAAVPSRLRRSTPTSEPIFMTKSRPESHIRRGTHYPNIPNENQHQLLTTSVHGHTRKKTFNGFASVTDSSHNRRYKHQKPSSPHSINIVKRQLRSSGAVSSSDYSKRTLRTRNSLAKDLKAKATLLSGIKRNTPSSPTISKHCMRSTNPSLLETAANMVRTRLSTQLQKSQIQSNCPTPTTNKCSSANGNSRKVKLTKLVKSQNHLPAINLRSRKVSQQMHNKSPMVTSSSKLNKSIPTSTNSMHRERRSLRNCGKTNLRSVLSQTPTTISTATCYSKSTRMQGSSGALIIPTPSPRLFASTAAAVAAATRARSFLTTRSLNSSDQSSPVGISALYAKRSRIMTLRSGDNTMENNKSNTLGCLRSGSRTSNSNGRTSSKTVAIKNIASMTRNLLQTTRRRAIRKLKR